MKKIMFKLKPGVTPVEQNGVPGLFFAGNIRLAKDAQQTALIHALTIHEQTLEALQKILHARGGSSAVDADAALSLAAFILDFEDYIES